MVRNALPRKSKVPFLIAAGALLALAALFTGWLSARRQLRETSLDHFFSAETIEKTTLMLNNTYREPSTLIREKIRSNPDLTIYLGLNPAKQESLELLAYLLPVLAESRGTLYYPFLRAEDQQAIDELWATDNFSEEKARELMFQANPLWGYQEYLDFLASYHTFVHNLRAGESLTMKAAYGLPMKAWQETDGIKLVPANITGVANRQALSRVTEKDDLLIYHLTPMPGLPLQGQLETALARIPEIRRVTIIPVETIRPLVDFKGMKLADHTHLPENGYYLSTGLCHNFADLTWRENFITKENSASAQRILFHLRESQPAQTPFTAFPPLPSEEQISSASSLRILKRLAERMITVR